MRKKHAIVAAGMTICMALTAFAGCGPAGIKSSTGETQQNSQNNASADGTEGTTVSFEENLLDPENPVTVTFYSYSLYYPNMKDGMEHLIQVFNDTVGKEKGVIVEGVPDDLSKYKTDIQAGNQVDVIQHIFATLDASKKSLGIQAFEDVFPEEEPKAQFEGIPENALSLGVIDGKTYGMAFTLSTPILYINGTLFEQAGLDPNEPPTTWEEMLEMAKTIKEKTGVDGFGLGPDNGWVTEGIVYTAGSDMVNEDKTEAVFATEETAQAFELWKSFYTEGCAAKGADTELSQQFSSGKLAMHIQSSAALAGYVSASASLFINSWNDYMWPSLLSNRIEDAPLQIGLKMFVSSDVNMWGSLMAATTVSCIPILAFYLVMQKNIVNSFMKWGIK